MWSAGSREAQVYLGLGVAGVLAPGSTDAPIIEWLSCVSAIDGWSQASALLKERLRSRRVRVWLSGALCRPFVVQPVDGLRNRREAYRIASEMAPDRTGLAGPCDIWLDRWKPDEANLCVAINRDLRDEIEAIAKRTDQTLVGLAPWWNIALGELLQGQLRLTRLLAIDDTDALTMLSGQQGRFTSATSVVPKPDPMQVSSVVARMGFTEGLGTGESVYACMVEEQGSRRFDVRFETGQ